MRSALIFIIHQRRVWVPRQVRGRAAVPSARWFLLQLLRLWLQVEKRRRRLPQLQLGKPRIKRSVDGVLAAEIRNVHLPTLLLTQHQLLPRKGGNRLLKVQLSKAQHEDATAWAKCTLLIHPLPDFNRLKRRRSRKQRLYFQHCPCLPKMITSCNLLAIKHPLLCPTLLDF